MHDRGGEERLGRAEVDRTELERRDLEGPVGEDREVDVEDRQDVRGDVVQDHVGDEDAEGQGGQGQVEAPEPEGGERDQATDQRGDDDAEEQPPDRDPLVEPGAGETQVEHDDRGDGPEGDRGQVDLTGIARQQGERQGDDGVGDADGERPHVVGAHDLLEGQDGEHEDQAPGDGGAHGGDREPLPGAQQGGAAQPVLGQHQQDDEQRDHGQGDAEVRGPGPRRREVGQHVGGREPEDQGAGEGQPDAAQPPEHGGGDGVEDEQGQHVDVERAAADGGDEDAGQRGQRAAERPRDGRQPDGPSTVQLQEGRVVDDGPHGHAGAGAGEEQADAHRDQHPAAEGDGLVIGDVDAEELEFRRDPEEEEVVARHAGIPDPLGQRDQPEHDADGHHDLGDVGRLPEPPHDAGVEDRLPAAVPARRSRRRAPAAPASSSRSGTASR